MHTLRQRRFLAGFGTVLLATMVVCPMMAAAASVSATPGCHETSSSDAPADPSAALNCCAVELHARSLAPARDDDTSLPNTLDALMPAGAFDRALARPIDQRGRLDRLKLPAAPLFLQHASLLI